MGIRITAYYNFHPLFFFYNATLAPLFFITGLTLIGKGIKSAVINHRIKKDLKNKTCHENKLIASGDFYEGLIIVKSTDLKNPFALRLQEEKNKDNHITFIINLKENPLMRYTS